MSNESVHPGLQELRAQLQSADQHLLKALIQRYQIVQQIAALKRAIQLPVVQTEFRNQSFQQQTEFARSLGLPDDWTAQLLNLLHELSVETQNQLISQNEQANE